MTETLLNQTRTFVSGIHATDKSGHDLAHIERVCQNAEQLLEGTPEADAFVVRMSALLHDVDDHKLGGDGRRAERFLATLPIFPDTRETILKTINAIGFSQSGACPQFDTIEQAVLSDADKLDALGAVGVCRTILFGAHRGTPLFDAAIFPAENLTPAEYKNLNRKTNTSINHFFDKLLRLKGAMQTPTGRRIAERRHQFLIDFLTCFFEEQGLTDWLSYLKNWRKNN